MFSEAMLQAIARAEQNVIQNSPKPGESYSKRTGLLLSLIARKMREARNLSRFVGGVRLSRTFKGDAVERASVESVGAAEQRQAVQILVRNFLKPGAMSYSPEVLRTMASDETASPWNAPLRQVIGGQQARVAVSLVSASAIDRIAENSQRVPLNPYTLSEHYGLVVGAVYNEIGTGKPITDLRRDLQRTMLDSLINQAGAPAGLLNSDARVIALSTVRRLQTRIQGQLKSTSNQLDEISALHLKEMDESIGRFLNRSQVINR